MTEPKTKTLTQADEASERLRQRAKARYYEGDANLIAIDIVAQEYEPRVAKLEAQLADLRARLGESGEGKTKGGK
jgi:hypothetical protein